MHENLITDRFLVYGTLRPGCCNYDSFFPYVNHTVETVRVPGYAMHGVRGFPYAVRATKVHPEGSSIVCSLITVTDTPSNMRALQRGLDLLEGYDAATPYANHYDRIQIDVNGERAHLYIASNFFRDRHVSTLPLLESGDWYEVSPPQKGPYMAYFWDDSEDSGLSDLYEEEHATEEPTVA